MTLNDLINALGNEVSGKCYIASEAAQYILGKDKWKPCVVHHEGGTHWFLRNRLTDEILDLTSSQFKSPVPYNKGRGCGFLTKNPSKKTQELLNSLFK